MDGEGPTGWSTRAQVLLTGQVDWPRQMALTYKDVVEMTTAVEAMVEVMGRCSNPAWLADLG